MDKEQQITNTTVKMNELEVEQLKKDIEDIWKYVDENKAYTQYNDKRIDQLLDDFSKVNTVK